tara:strand:- start:885 stop:1307 length:423 start_codon:yes stop_codon:yes gene_type:complete
MKKLIIILIASNLLASKEDIVNVLNKYNEAFIAKDYKNIIKNFDLPTSFNLSSKTINVSNKLKLNLIYRKLIGDLPEYYSYSKWDDIKVEIIDKSIAIAYTQFSRYKKDNSIFYKGSVIYFLRKIDTEWKIFSLTPYNNI